MSSIALGRSKVSYFNSPSAINIYLVILSSVSILIFNSISSFQSPSPTQIVRDLDSQEKRDLEDLISTLENDNRYVYQRNDCAITAKRLAFLLANSHDK